MNLPTREEAKEAMAWFEPNLEENIGLTPDHIRSIEIFKKIALAYSSDSLIEARTEGEIEKVLINLAEKQLQAVIRTVDKKGLMNTDWSDIESEGGSLDFKTIAHALVGKV